MSEHPSLTREDILASLRYASRLSANHFTLEANSSEENKLDLMQEAAND